jgi:chromosome segregation ATPase
MQRNNREMFFSTIEEAQGYIDQQRSQKITEQNQLDREIRNLVAATTNNERTRREELRELTQTKTTTQNLLAEARAQVRAAQDANIANVQNQAVNLHATIHNGMFLNSAQEKVNTLQRQLDGIDRRIAQLQQEPTAEATSLTRLQNKREELSQQIAAFDRSIEALARVPMEAPTRRP